MKKYIILMLAFAALSAQHLQAQKYFVSSLATPGSATFSAGQTDDGVISIPFGAGTRTIEVETNQEAKVSCDADWCKATLDGKTLTLTVTENSTEEARNAILSISSKDFHPLLLTVRQEARLAFAVISDVHVGSPLNNSDYKVKVPQAIQRLTQFGKLDVLAVCGDLTNNGRSSQYTEFVNIFGNEKNFTNPVDKLLFMMGNHDNYEDKDWTNYRQGLRSFNNNRLYPYHQYCLIKGYPFISISIFAGGNSNFDDELYNDSYPKAAVDQLKKYLKQAAEEAPGKPIFVFTHIPPYATCYSSWPEYENGVAWSMKILNRVLNEYPQTVVFAGHSHYPLGDPRSIHQGANPNSKRKNYFTAINTASTTYSELHPQCVEGKDGGIHPTGFEYVTEGMILYEQPNGDIEIRRYDTYRNVEIAPEDRWVLKAPFDGSMFQYADIRDKDDNPNNVTLRDGLPAPSFTNGAKITLVPGYEDVKITFPQATDNECVFRYDIRVTKGEEVVKNTSIFSQFYLTTDMPKELSYTVSGLEPNIEYSVEVVAYDSYDNQSTSLKSTFTTLNDEAPIPDAIGTWTFDDANNLMAGTGTATLTGAMIEMGSVVSLDNPATAKITPVNGPLEGNGAISIPVGSGLKMTTNLEQASLSNYTLMFDIRSEQLSGYTAIYQNDLTNKKDGSFFINNGQLGLNSNSLGYNGKLTSGQWHRVVFVSKDNAVILYLDGKRIGQSSSANAQNWQMGTGGLFFLDNDGEEHVIETAEIRFWNVVLTSKQIATLGTATQQEIPEDPIPEALGTWTFDNATDLLAGTGSATLKGTTHPAKNGVNIVTIASDLAAVGIVPVAGPSEGNGAINVPKGCSLLMDAGLKQDNIGTYTIMFDVKAKDCSTYIPLLQNSITDTKDGSLFINNYKVGLGNQLGYHGSIENGKWYRIVFVVEPYGASLYVNGKLLTINLNCANAYNLHWLLTTGALFFADDDGEEKDIQTAEIRFWNSALNEAQIEKLGKVQ